MTRHALALLLLLGSFATLCQAATEDAAGERNTPIAPPLPVASTPGSAESYHPNRIVVALKRDTAVDLEAAENATVALSDLTGFAEVATRMNVTRLRPLAPGFRIHHKLGTPEALEADRWFVIEFDGPTPDEVVAAYGALPQVEEAMKDGVVWSQYVPNDTDFDDPYSTWPHDQWHLREAPGIDAERAWDFTTGDSTVLVGVIDSGVCYDHIDFYGVDPVGPSDPVGDSSIWVNTGEIPANGIDEDGNGYADDIIGYDFLISPHPAVPCVDADCRGRDNDPFDGHGHGTYCAGLLGARSGSGQCVAGVAGGRGDGTRIGPRQAGVRIVPCRVLYLASSGIGSGGAVSDLAEAMWYLGDLKAAGWNIAAVSISIASTMNAFQAPADYLASLDVLVVACAGNDNNSSIAWPAALPNVLAVGATDSHGVPAGFSNYGSSVDVAAPGVDIVSITYAPEDPTARGYVSYSSGTSAAAPQVAGIAALLKSYDPSLTRQDLWDLIVDNTTPYTPTKYVGSGIANAWLALQQILDEVVVTHTGPSYHIDPTRSQELTASVRSYGGGTIPGTGVVAHYRVDGGSYAAVALSPVAGTDDFVGALPPQPMGSLVEYYIEATNDEGQIGRHPRGAPASLNIYAVGNPIAIDFEAPGGWSTGSPEEETGAPGWAWADPEGTVLNSTQVQLENDHSDSGTKCWVTGPLAGTAAGTYDLDGGNTVLYSPRFDLTGATEVELSYWYHYFDRGLTGADLGFRPFLSVEITNDAGASWTELRHDRHVTSGWTQVAANLDTLFAAPGVVQLRFTASDRQNSDIVEAMLDDFQLTAVYNPSSAVDDLQVRLPGQLLQNVPNPFNPVTEIGFSLPMAQAVRIELYDARGRLVRRLVSDTLPEGAHVATWDGRDDAGHAVASGVYHCRMSSAGHSQSRSMVLVR